MRTLRRPSQLRTALVAVLLWTLTLSLAGCARSSPDAAAASKPHLSGEAASESYEVLLEDKEETVPEEPAADEVDKRPMEAEDQGAAAGPAAAPMRLALAKRELRGLRNASGAGDARDKFGQAVRRPSGRKLKKAMQRRDLARVGALGLKKPRAGKNDGLDDAVGGELDVRSLGALGHPHGSKGAPAAGALLADGSSTEGRAAGRAAQVRGKRAATLLLGDDGKDADSEQAAVDLPTDERPSHFLPHMGYFENTYLGGNAAYRERLRRLSSDLAGADRAWLKARAAVAEVDPPPSAGMALSATLDRKHLDGPGRVWLQIGLRGSRRYGWRRPPLDVAVVLTPSARANSGALERSQDVVQALARKLGAQDRIEVRVAHDQGGTVVQEAVAATELRHRTVPLLDRLAAAPKVPLARAARALSGTLAAAGASLVRLSDNPHRVPGTRLVLVVSGAGARAAVAERAAHQLKLSGAVVSVLSVAEATDAQGWWRVANAGHGSYHRVVDAGAKATVDAELATLSRVVARLLRLNLNLGRDTRGVRILGSRMLGQREVKAVKAREKRVDQALSKSMGVKADRGDDDDGLQTVIPYFFGDDSHVILVELWVERPGAVADITLRYKDLVNLDNATARVSVSLDAAPRRPSPAQREVRRNVRAMRLALSLEDAWRATARGDNMAAMPALKAAERAARSAQDQHMVRGLQRLILDNRVAPAKRQRAVRDALRMARDRKVGYAGQ